MAFPQITFSSLFTRFNREGHFHIVISPNSDTKKFVNSGEREREREREREIRAMVLIITMME